jgi:hypothetical protein
MNPIAPYTTGISQSAADMSRHLNLFNKARFHVSHVIQTESSTDKLSHAFTTYAKALTNIREPVDMSVKAQLTGINLRVEKARQKTVSNLIVEMIGKFEDQRTKFEIRTVLDWAKRNGVATKYFLYSAVLESYCRELKELAASLGYVFKKAAETRNSLKSFLKRTHKLIMKEAIVEALEEFDKDDTFRKSYENFRQASGQLTTNQHNQFLVGYDEVTMKDIINRAKQDLMYTR